MSENTEKWQSAQGDIMKMLILSEQQSKSQMYSIYYHGRLRKQPIFHTWEAELSLFPWHFSLKKTNNLLSELILINQLIVSALVSSLLDPILNKINPHHTVFG